MTTKAFALCKAIFVLCIVATSALAQNPSSRLVGYSGELKVIPNVQFKQVTVVLHLTSAPASHSNQIVFQLQSEYSTLPAQWIGTAKVFASDSELAIIPADHTRGIVFRFPDRIASGLTDFGPVSEYYVYGIARYGEQTPLTRDQIEVLTKTGSCPRATSNGYIQDGIRLIADTSSPRLIRVQGVGCSGCIAGGPGSSQCSDGCSVTCTSRYYACCNGITCKCCPNVY